MIRFFVWQCGTIAFVAVIWRYGYWREILPLAVFGSAFLWIVCGGIMLSRGGRKGARQAHDSPVDADVKSNENLRSAFERYKQAGQSDTRDEYLRANATQAPPSGGREK